ncbi:MAG: lysine--tRNA ligase [Patescibacteria group bacterium]|nr:lysine--tRNA ligase [Patescibacteria group bacterium]
MTGEVSLRAAREQKLALLGKRGLSPWPARTGRTHEVRDFRRSFADLKDTAAVITLAGRVRSIREHGGSTFLHLDDGTGQAQAYLKKDRVGAEPYELFLDVVDIGDFIEATGVAFLTKRGEETLEVGAWKFLGKSLSPLPEKWHGLQDQEERFRHRYLDILTNPATRERFLKRADFLRNIRAFLDREGFFEVETAVLEHIPSGAEADPYKTHMNALDLEVFLRISLELPLKKLIVAGYPAVYEIGRVFRNEGMDQQHLPEGFTMLEFYVAWRDYRWLMEFTERMYSALMEKTFGTLTVRHEAGAIDFTPPWPRLSYKALFKEKTGIDLDAVETHKALERIGREKRLDVDFADAASKPDLIDKIYKRYVRRDLVQPVFIIDHPFETTPLAKRKEDDSSVVERFQVVAVGAEIANAFSELNDPEEQLRRFRAYGGRVDEEFVEALRYGMPPTAGFGVGIDRLFMIMAGIENIRETILFPLMRPKPHQNQE